LSPGQRLVSQAGDLWRWDGFCSKAGAPKPAEARLKQRARLAELEGEIAAAQPAADAAKRDAEAAATRVGKAENAVRIARPAPREAEVRAAAARDKLETLAREGARRDARAQSLDETIG